MFIEFFIVVGLIAWLIVHLIRKRARRARRLDELEASVATLESRLGWLEQRIDLTEQALKPAAARAVEAPAPALRAPAAREVRLEPEPAWQAVGPAEEPGRRVHLPKISEAASRRWRAIEHAFVENWTGILGSVVVVAGVTFVGIYTALRLAPFNRFLLTVAAAAVFIGASFVLGRHENWRTFSAWLRSAGAAILLFACAAAGGLPGLGLQWIEAPTLALAVLLVGIAANLYLAHAGGTQVFASLHVILSLLPLAIVNQGPVTLAVATAVVAFGVLLAFRPRWDRHLLVTLLAGAVFHVSWYWRMGEALGAAGLQWLALASAAVVAGIAVLIPHRGAIVKAGPFHWPLAGQLTAWTGLALAALAYPALTGARSASLAAAGAAAWVLGRRAAGRGVEWLRVTDTLVGQILVVAALLACYQFAPSLPLVLLAVYVESLVFLRLMVPAGRALLGTVATIGAQAAGLVLALAGLAELTAPAAERLVPAGLLLAGTLAGLTAHLFLCRRQARVAATADAAQSLPSSWLALRARELPVVVPGVLAVAALLLLSPGPRMEWVALALGVLLVAGARRSWAPGLAIPTAMVAAGAHVLCWAGALAAPIWPASLAALHLAPLAALAALVLVASRATWLRQGAIYALGADLGLAAWIFLAPVSPLIPPVAWLLLSLVALELANRVAKPYVRPALLCGYLYVAAFAAGYALLVMQTTAYVGPVRARMLIELFGLAALGYWWRYRPRELMAAERLWLRAHPLFLELLLVAVVVVTIVEVPLTWRAASWGTMAVLLMGPPLARRLDARLRPYSLLFYWTSVAMVAAVLGIWQSPGPNWYERPDLTALVAIALQAGYVALSHRWLALESIELTAGFGWLQALSRGLGRRRNLWVYYPFFAGIAMFLFWRFDRSVLTLLWAAEAFGIFALSALLRENQFRYVALAGLGACLIRLVLIDMAEANLGLRGVMFIGVGLLMLGMNAIYNRYRARFGE